MKEILLDLMKRLEAVGEQHEELYDTEVRNAMGRTIFRGFLRPEPEFELVDDFLDAPDANKAIQDALVAYIQAAKERAPQLGYTTFHQRLAAFQDCGVFTESGATCDEFFGAYNPKLYGSAGEWLG